MTYPVSHPKHEPIPKMRKKSANGNQFTEPYILLALQLSGQGRNFDSMDYHTWLNPFRSSLSAKITNINIELATSSETNWVWFVMKVCGYVQKIPAVAVGEGGTVRTP